MMDRRHPLLRLLAWGLAIGTGCLIVAGPWTEVALAQPKNVPPVQGVGLPVLIGGNIPEAAQSSYDTILTEITRAGVVALMNALQQFLGKIAYDAASYIASGGKGQDAVYFKKGFGDYLANTAQDAAGEFLGSLSEDGAFKKLGIDFCKPKDPRAMLQIQLSLASFLPPQPGSPYAPSASKCNFQDVIKNYQDLYQTMSQDDIYKNVQLSLDPQRSDLGSIAAMSSRMLSYVETQVDDKTKERIEGSGYKSVVGKISGNIRTPAQTIREESDQAIVRDPKAGQAQISGAILQNAFNQGPIQLAMYTSQIFINTLTSKLMKRVFEKGLDAFDLSNVQLTSPDALVVVGKTDARQANIDLRTPNLQQVETVNVVSDLIACPTTNRGPWNCVIDQQLNQAIQGQGDQGGITVGEALARGFLNPDWHLIPSDSAHVKQDQDPDCYKKDYCASNLRKLRVLRILPAGFEFAANAQANIKRCTDGECVKLKEVVDGFSNCDPMTGERTEKYPWCHLIDKNWVIASLPQQCVLNGYGDQLLSSQLNQRRQECRDIQTCLQRNNRGECVGGYGYCVADKTVYRFQATECLPRYASCRAYENRAGDGVSYLRNTLDYGQCNADNVGCLWYATTYDPAGTSTVKWVGTTTTGPRVYFDKTIEPCSANDEGCTKLYAAPYAADVNAPAPLNLLLNPSFERTTSTPAVFADWKPATQPSVTLPGVSGSASAEVTNAGYSQTIAIAPLRMYTVSAYLRAKTGGQAGNLTVLVKQYKTDQDAFLDQPLAAGELAGAFRSSGCTQTGDNHVEANASTAATEWKRIQCSFYSSAATRVGIVRFTGAGLLVDAVQLEEGEFATGFIDGLNTSLAATYMKLAPDEFGCTETTSTNHPACAKFAQICRQSEAACQGYTDVDGGSEVPAVIGIDDLCPKECVGYAEYRKQPSAFDLTPDVDSRFDDAVDTAVDHFIASTAQSCTQADAGCEEFTNVASVAQGGEQKAYFSYVRSCEKPDQGSTAQTYFTWEGSDTTGFQLHTWSLKQAPNGINLNAQYNFKEVEAANGPNILLKRGPDQIRFKEPNTCGEALWRTAADPDCRQFYDAGGNVFYRYYSQTILSTPDCASYRIGKTSQNDCLKTGGQFNNNRNECVYQVYAPESRTCSAQAVSCRAYAGSGAGNLQRPLFVDFRSGLAGFTNGEISKEALLVGDSSLKLVPKGGKLETTVDVATKSEDLLRATFWAKAPAAQGQAQFTVSTADVQNANNRKTVGTINLGSDWQQFTVGPFAAWSGAATTTLVWTGSGTALVYLDEVTVNRIQDMVYVRAGTWNTPATCDVSRSGIPQPQAMLGCREYRDRNKQTVYVRQFTRLCRQAAIGCREFVDTRNSDAVGGQAFVMQDNPPIAGFGAATTSRGADRYVYLIDDPSKHCQAENASCRAFGKPTFSADRLKFEPSVYSATSSPFETVYLKDDITKYDVGLCRPSEIFCEEFSSQGGKEYFRDPQKHVCEYKENVSIAPNALPGIAAGSYTGWFRQGTSVPCYPGVLESGKNFNLLHNGDANFLGWGGLCPQEASECTEFRDPNDKSDPLHQDGKSYFFLRDNTLESSAGDCSGNVDVGRGCILVRDLSDASLKYNVAASYENYRAKHFDPVQPISCPSNSTDPLCQKRQNDANLLIKVNVDRDCAQWLGCKSAETVFDQATQKFKDVCTNLALCDQSSQQSGDMFCAHYVDRTSTEETTLHEGALFSVDQYANRKIGLGEKDYAGYSIPNAFQIPDLVSTKVAVTALQDPSFSDVKYTYALDYRLAAAVKIHKVQNGNLETSNPDPNSAVLLDSKKLGYPGFNLCQHVGSKVIGYFNPSEVPALAGTYNCYLPVRVDYDINLAFADLLKKFIQGNPNADPFLKSAFPPPECRAFPEADAPYPASYVLNWNRAKNPPKPTDKLPGYAAANTCEYGEDCSCTYKRVDYSAAAVTKFYDSLSPSVLPGVCAGGPRDGQSCLPDTVFKLPSSGGGQQNPQIKAAEGSNASQSCGPPEMGGRCVPFSKVEVVRGIFGQCLERDHAITIGPIDSGEHPCLTWNPTPILFGEKDPYHYQPTSGYLPPENSGQYYCLSYAKPSSRKRMEEADFAGYDQDIDKSQFAGSIKKLNYDDDFVSDAQASAADKAGLFFSGGLSAGSLPQGNKEGAYLFGGKPEGSAAAAQCEQADGGQSDNDNSTDPTGLILVQAGREPERSYTETFYRVNQPVGINNIGFLSVSPMLNPNNKGRLGCGYQADWVDGLGEVDYGNDSTVAEKDKEWREKFFEKYNPTLSRGSEKMLSGAEAGVDFVGFGNATPSINKALPLNCANDNAAPCYFKYWETGYRADSGSSFVAFKRPTAPSFDNLRLNPFSQACTSDQPYFSIRAVFQTDARSSKNGGPQDDEPGTIDLDKVKGTWYFVGFWVSTCGGQSHDNRFIYMNVEQYSADVCTQLAEVRSRNSKQDAAFTDRVWKNGDFAIPSLGIQYGSRWSPFSSALNTGVAGLEPLFQSGGAVAGFSPLKTPTFLSSGVSTYYRDDVYPKDKWAFLSNIFARIYRVYLYNEQTVTRGTKVCLDGPFKGKACTPGKTSPEDGANGGAQNRSSDCEYIQPAYACGPLKNKLPEFSNPDWGRCMDPKDANNKDADAAETVWSEDCSLGNGNDSRTLACNFFQSFDCIEIPKNVCLDGPNYHVAKDDDVGGTYKNLNSLVPCNPDDAVLACGRPAPQLTHTCGSVDSGPPNFTPSAQCDDATKDRGNPQPNGSLDPDNDNNICTHSPGYYPRIDLCPNPNDEFCGLRGYDLTSANGASLDPANPNFVLPTDVTMGHYSPAFLGFVLNDQKISAADAFKYVSYYNPRPPRIAAPDVRACPTPGTCPIQHMDAFNFNGQSEGSMSAVGGQFKAEMRFYGWASHEQMPIRKVVIDWGDGSRQELSDARLKNRKPFCGVQKECSDPVRGAGLTCSTDSDCPPGTGSCLPIGTCNKRQNVSCHTDADCTLDKAHPDTCNVRTLFGNSPDACERDYFDFTHLYSCLDKTSVAKDANGNPVICGDTTQQKTGLCARNPAVTCVKDADCGDTDTCTLTGLAGAGGCWDANANSCRFTPRVYMEDNWGWCTGECRAKSVAGQLQDDPASKIRHPYGGCYAAQTTGSLDVNVKTNDVTKNDKIVNSNNAECVLDRPQGSQTLHPWIIYPGALQLGSSK